MHSAVCPELCINSNTQKQAQHFCRFPSISSLQGIAHNNTVHMSGSNTALTEEWLIFLQWPDSHLSLLAQSGSGAGAALTLQMVLFQLRKTLRLALHSLSDMPT